MRVGLANVTVGCELGHIHAARFLQGWCRGTGSWLVKAIGSAISPVLVAGKGETAIMEKARATFFATYLSGFKPSLFAMLFGGVTTATAVFAMVSQAGTAVPLILKALNLPSCRTSDVYRGTQSDFKKERDVWREYPAGAVAYRYEFKEINRTREKIMLRNLTPRDTKDWETLTVHLPACNGIARLSEGLPERWTDLQEVWRAPRES
jgi:hypothetical protein